MPHTVEVTAADGKKTTLTASDIVIATGASPMMIPGVQADGKNVLTYLEAIVQDHLPRSVVVIGASAIGCEFATVWNSYGAEVTLVEMLPRVAPLEDEEVSQELTRAFAKRGIRVMAGTKVEGIEVGGAGVRVQVAGAEGASTIEAEQALVAIGVRPNTTGPGAGEDRGEDQSARHGRDRRPHGDQRRRRVGHR